MFWIVAYPSAKMLDTWLGQDGVHYIREQYLKAIIENHMNAAESDLTHREGAGALNFLSLEDLAVGEEGEAVGRRQ
ncbi:MAG: metal transporter CNNM [Candidatus Azotimanducaceae bacterium]